MKNEEAKTRIGNTKNMTIVAVIAIMLVAGAGSIYYYGNMVAKPPTTPITTPPTTPTDTIPNTSTPTTAEPEQTEPTTTVKPIEITAEEFKKLIDKIYIYQLQNGLGDDMRTVKRQEVEPYNNQSVLVTGLIVTNIDEEMIGTEKYYYIKISSESNKHYVWLFMKASEAIAPKIGQSNVQGILIFDETYTWPGPVGYIENAQIIKDR